MKKNKQNAEKTAKTKIALSLSFPFRLLSPASVVYLSAAIDLEMRLSLPFWNLAVANSSARQCKATTNC